MSVPFDAAINSTSLTSGLVVAGNMPAWFPSLVVMITVLGVLGILASLVGGFSSTTTEEGDEEEESEDDEEPEPQKTIQPTIVKPQALASNKGSKREQAEKILGTKIIGGPR